MTFSYDISPCTDLLQSPTERVTLLRTAYYYLIQNPDFEYVVDVVFATIRCCIWLPEAMITVYKSGEAIQFIASWSSDDKRKMLQSITTHINIEDCTLPELITMNHVAQEHQKTGDITSTQYLIIPLRYENNYKGWVAFTGNHPTSSRQITPEERQHLSTISHELARMLTFVRQEK